ncbi:hypothetical protein EC968_007655 [Mortierella alpina]|nr:hypothetical protein EC968_007655 [Mortierella alpina]
MLTLLSSSANMASTDVLNIAIPVGLGLASAAYLTMNLATGNSFSTDKSIPLASLRPGDRTHDKEYFEDPDAFLQRCEEEYGPVFNIFYLGQSYTVISGPQIREVFLNEDFSVGDALDELNGLSTYFVSLIKSNRGDFNRVIHEIVRDHVSPNLPLFTPRIVKEMEKVANVFVGPEIAKSRKVIDTFFTVTADFGEMIEKNTVSASPWRRFFKRTELNVLNPLQIHVQVLVDAATPVILERHRQEAEAMEQGIEYQRPEDVLQRMLDNFDNTNLLYYMAAYPEYLGKLYEEQQQVLDAIQQERELLREELRKKGEPIDADMDPSRDRDMSSVAVKGMVYMDSFVREVFRNRTERLSLPHLARKSVKLSSGILISKGCRAIINMRSAHQGPDQGEEVTEFRPWRFVGKPKAATKVGADYLPFGMGRHACPGRFLAMQELKTIGALMVSKYSQIEVQDPTKLKTVLRSRVGEPTATGLIFSGRF